MPFKYHPPTRSHCAICETLLANQKTAPLIDAVDGKASKANEFPFHNWYNFVLGYTPDFPRYILEQADMTTAHFVVDPFMGSGTTLVECKRLGIPSWGIDANDFMVDAARVKLDWDVDLPVARAALKRVIAQVQMVYDQYDWSDAKDSGGEIRQLPLFTDHTTQRHSLEPLLTRRRPQMLVSRYISDKPLARLLLLDDVIQACVTDEQLRTLFDMALTAIIVPISNVRYGPGFGVAKPRDDIDVLSIFSAKMERMLADLLSVTSVQRQTPAAVCLGDTRQLTRHLASNSVDLMITSPPYPGDHEYTKHTRLELIYRGYAQSVPEFRNIKQRMLRASTTNIYKQDRDGEAVRHMESIRQITTLIQQRLDNDGATSGFEKLYTRLVWEYFGGMHQALSECLHVLKPGGKIALLVSDSHAFKMVHIQTADILSEIGLALGYRHAEIVLWQLKTSTSHKYMLRENILILQK